MARIYGNLVLEAGNEDLGGPGVFVGDIPPGLSTKRELLHALREALRFPSYAGNNWDALEECLRDLSWIRDRRVVLRHHDLPRLEQPSLRTYLEILDESSAGWKGKEEHELLVVFPEDVETGIQEVLSDSVDEQG